MVEVVISEVLLAFALGMQVWGFWEHRALAKRTGWMAPFVFWTLICVGMAIPRVLAELIAHGFFWRGLALQVHMFTFAINSILVVCAAKSFSRHIDRWLDHLIELERKSQEPVKVEATLELSVKEPPDVVP